MAQWRRVARRTPKQRALQFGPDITRFNAKIKIRKS
jgi:hypothetical protein